MCISCMFGLHAYIIIKTLFDTLKGNSCSSFKCFKEVLTSGRSCDIGCLLSNSQSLDGCISNILANPFLLRSKLMSALRSKVEV